VVVVVRVGDCQLAVDVYVCVGCVAPLDYVIKRIATATDRDGVTLEYVPVRVNERSPQCVAGVVVLSNTRH